jgi:hypothetical protein
MKTDAVCQDLVCDHSYAERPRYYARQLITDEIMRLEQRYFIDRMRRHNRMMHGWGVVCGANVCPNPVSRTTDSGYRPWEVLVQPGYILGPYGDEIIIDCERIVDLRTSGVSGVTGDPCVELVDPWCSDVFMPRDPTAPLFIAVKYKECQTRPVRVQPVGCGCDDTQCENSRLRDGYEIAILPYCPEPHVANPVEVKLPVPDQDLRIRFEGPLAVCPQCPAEPWVALARVTVDEDGAITEIDNCECRRIVVSPANLSIRCVPAVPKVTEIDPKEAKAGEKNIPMTLIGENFKPGLRLYMGSGITFDLTNAKPNADGKKYENIIANIDANADPGTRNLTVITPDCATGTFRDLFTVILNTTLKADAKAGETPPEKDTAPTPRGPVRRRAK